MAGDRVDTRASLLLRIREPDDEAAWAEFVDIYAPLLYSFCRKRQLSHEEIQDVMQEIYRAVAKAIPRFEYDPRRGHFSSWLFQVAFSKVARFYEKKKRQAHGERESALFRLVDRELAVPPPDWERDHRRALFHWAAQRVKHEFAERSWTAFWMTAVEERPVKEAAAATGMREGSVYVAKSRVLARLRRELETVDMLGDIPA